MSWRYQQSTGKLFRSVDPPAEQPRPAATETEACGPTWQLEGEGYSGHGAGVNNPLMQAERDLGPIPRGFYDISGPFDHPTRGDFVMRLTPRPGDEMFRRSGFLMHGDLKSAPGKHLASLGCIIMPRDVRERVAESGDKLLEVVE